MPKKSSSHLKNGSRRSKGTDGKRGVTDLRFASASSLIKSISDETSNAKRDQAGGASTKIVPKTECVLLPVNSTITSSSRTYAEVVAEVEPISLAIGSSERQQLSAPPSQSELDYWEMVADACADVLHKIDAQCPHPETNKTDDTEKDFEFQDWLLTYVPNNLKNPWDSEEVDDWIHVTNKSTQCNNI